MVIFLNKYLPRSEIPLVNKEMSEWTIPRVIYCEPASEFWEYCPKPLKNESFSSYFTRVAKANFAEPLGILINLNRKKFRHYNKQKYVLDKIIDRNSLLLILKHLKLNDQDKENILLSCDRPLHPRITNIFHCFAKYVVEGTRFCPLCLKEDDIPHFRYYWRFSFVTACFKHKQLLDKVCPQCNQSIKFWLTSWEKSLTTCYFCGNDICNNQNLV